MQSEEYFDNSYIDYFQKGDFENTRFWSRFNNFPNFEDTSVLEIGSGTGSLCVSIASKGAKKVVGLDINQGLIDFANGYLKKINPHLVNIVQFECLDLKYYNEEIDFDIIVSKDSFEHIIDLSSMLNEMKKRLKPGGKIYAGFGPIYSSPYGDHDRRKTILKRWGIFGQIIAKIPWGHLFFERTLITMNNRFQKKKINSMKDLQLNTLKWSDYFEIFQNSGLDIIYLQRNSSHSIQAHILSLLAKTHLLEDYCIFNCYIILKKS